MTERATAVAAGLKRYYTGKPCPKGHVAERFVSDKSCTACRADSIKVWRALNPARISEHNKRYYNANRGIVNAIFQTRRARKCGAEGRYTKGDIAKLLVAQDNKCIGCKIPFSTTKPTVDHVVPLSRGGSNWPSNLQLLCISCNDKKGIKLMCEWNLAV